eukprot:1408653-Rhodomonas_salina.3
MRRRCSTATALGPASGSPTPIVRGGRQRPNLKLLRKWRPWALRRGGAGSGASRTCWQHTSSSTRARQLRERDRPDAHCHGRQDDGGRMAAIDLALSIIACLAY